MPQVRRTLKVIEAAEILGISRYLAYRLVQTGELPTIRVGKELRVPKQVIEGMLAAAGAQPAEKKAQAASNEKGPTP